MYILNHINTTFNKNIVTDLLADKVSHYSFVETGTNLGAGVAEAVNLGFTNIFSIEIEQDFHDKAVASFGANPNVTLLLGDSMSIMKELCMSIVGPAFFWLDAHNGFNSPLLGEIDAIIYRNNPLDIIAIDDMRIIRQKVWWGQTLSIDDLYRKLSRYSLRCFDNSSAPDDILVAFK